MYTHKINQMEKYEGAGILIENLFGEYLFIVTEKDDGSLQAEFPGGKIEESDDGNSKRTVLRELQEETGIYQVRFDDLITKLETIGGYSGYPSILWITRRFNNSEIQTMLDNKCLHEKDKTTYFGTIYLKDGKWVVYIPELKDFIKVRKFNTFCFEQNKDSLNVT